MQDSHQRVMSVAAVQAAIVKALVALLEAQMETTNGRDRPGGIGA